MMDSDTSELRRIIGADADNYPMLAERIAIDATNALRSAEIGLRGFRHRPLLRRLWDGLTGRGQELQAAIGQDLVTVQRATLDLVREVMEEESRTQYCINRVSIILRDVNREVNDLLRRTSSLERNLDQELAAFRAEIRTEAKSLQDQINAVHRQIDKDANVRRLTEHYRAGDLTAGLGEMVGSALYLASVAWNYYTEQEEPDNRFKHEWEAAYAVVRQRLGREVRPIADALLEAVEAISLDSAESVLYLAESTTGALRCTGMLTTRRVAGLSIKEQDAEDAVAIASALYDPDEQLESGLIRDVELVKAIACELIPNSFGKEE